MDLSKEAWFIRIIQTLSDQGNKALDKTKNIGRSIALSISYISRAFTFANNAIHEGHRSRWKDFHSNEERSEDQRNNSSIRRLVNSIIEWVLKVYVKFLYWSNP